MDGVAAQSGRLRTAFIPKQFPRCDTGLLAPEKRTGQTALNCLARLPGAVDMPRISEVRIRPAVLEQSEGSSLESTDSSR
jgi:hypothetical protein